MSTWANEWISLPHSDNNGYSYVRLEDIDRVSLTCVKAPEVDTHFVKAFANGQEYLYTKVASLEKAETSAAELMNTIVGRKK